MTPGQTILLTIFRKTAGGLASAGKVLADFSVNAYLNGSTVSVTPAVTDLGAAGPDAEAYQLSVVLPGTQGIFAIRAPAAVGSDLVWPEFEIEVLNNDENSVYNVVAVPVVSVLSTGGPAGDIALRVVKNDYAVITFTVKDQTGTPINLSAWTGPVFAVKSQDQTSTQYSQSTGITMTAGGLVTIAIPKTATALYNALTTGVNSIQLYWQFVANNAGVSSQTQTLGRGSFTIVREEV